MDYKLLPVYDIIHIRMVLEELMKQLEPARSSRHLSLAYTHLEDAATRLDKAVEELKR